MVDKGNSENSHAISIDALAGLVVLDLGLGMAAALVAKFLCECGARVIRVEPANGDPFEHIYPAYKTWRQHEVLSQHSRNSSAEVERLAANSDICIVGGEDYPGLTCPYSPKGLADANPRLVVLSISGYPDIEEHKDRPAVEILVQARSGIVFEQREDDPFYMAYEPGSYGVTLHALSGLFAALYEREQSGKGQIVYASMFEGILTWTAVLWYKFEKPTPAATLNIPKGAVPLLLQCADGRYIHISLGSAGSKSILYNVLGILGENIDPNDNGMPSPQASGLRDFFGDVDAIAPCVWKRNSGELLDALWKAGIPVSEVLAPGECWDDPQIQHNDIVALANDGSRHLGFPISVQWSPAPRRPITKPGITPLTGVTVIDFGAFVAGPYASAILAELGADVIKVEPITGDPMRPSHCTFTSANHGKRAIAIDLKTEDGRDIAHKLCSNADVVLHNFRAGVSQRLGIDSVSLHRANPHLIVLESPGFGSSGPRANQAGFDTQLQAFSGHEIRAGGDGSPPIWTRTLIADYSGGMLGAVAILLALYHRSRSGAGANLIVPLINAALFSLSDVVKKPDGTFVGASSVNAFQTGRHPAECMYQAKDGWIAIAARDEASSRRLKEALQIEGELNSNRASWGDAEHKAISAAILGQHVSDVERRLSQADIWNEVCRRNTANAILHSRELEERGTVWHTHHPEFGEVRQIAALTYFSRSRTSTPSGTPLFGEHTNEILRQLGYSPDAIQAFAKAKCIA